MRERKPLIVMTPKPPFFSNQAAHSRLQDLAQDEFHPLLGESFEIERGLVSRVILTSGKLYYDLSSERERAGLRNAPILRVEQLYPFPEEALAQALDRFPRLREVVWAQEEAKNHGAWYPLRDRLEAALPPGATLTYAGRPAMAPTAMGDAARNAAEQRGIARSALSVAPD
jgi:2-oxoglutarate dehydrogenase E1 component